MNNEFRKQVVKIACKENLSSGVIIETSENSGLVICTKHGICGNKDDLEDNKVFDEFKEKIDIVDYYGNSLEVKSGRLYSNLDLCLIKVNKTQFYPRISPAIDIESNEKINIFGYPGMHREDGGIVYSSELKLIDDKHIEVLSKTSLSTFENTEYENAAGLSGGIMYIEKNGGIYFAGIVTEIIAENHSFRGIYIKKIVEILNNDYEYSFLPNESFSQVFDILSSKIRDFINADEKYINYFLKILENLVNGKLVNIISPEEIAKSNKKLWLEKNNERLAVEIWVYWLFVILIDYYYSNENFLMDYNDENSRKYIYMTNKTSASDVIKILVNNTTIKNNDLIFLANITEKFCNIGFDKNKLKKIVSKIDDFSVSDKLNIDDGETQKSFAGIDVDEFYKIIDSFLLDEEYSNYKKNFAGYVKKKMDRLIYGG